MLDVAGSRDRKAQMRVALGQGAAKARGAFSTSLDALSSLLHERARAALARGNPNAARAATRALDDVEQAKERASGNVNPQLITSELLRRLEDQLR
jgi:DNA polymerase-3 subunit delta'